LNRCLNKKRIVYNAICFIYATSLILVNCRGASKSRTTLTSCIEAVIEGDYEKAYGLFAFTDRSTMNLQEYIHYHKTSKAEGEFVEISRRYVTYEIKELSLMGDTARAVVKITTPEIIVEPFNLLFYEIYRKRKIDSIIDYQNRDTLLQMIDITGVVSLVSEHSGWHVHGRWEEQRRKEAEASKYKLDYIQNKLIIKNISIKEYQDVHKIIFSATVKNLGEKTLKDVEIFLVCSNINDKPRYTVTEHPISESGKPLGPMRTRKFKIDLINVPSDWARRIEIKIIDCEFAE